MSGEKDSRRFEDSGSSTPAAYTPPAQLSEAGMLEDFNDGSNMDDVHELARQITSASIRTTGGKPINPFIDSQDPALDPYSDNFSPKAWLKHIMNISNRDESRPPPLTAGVSFRRLGAYGYGTGADYQKTVGNVLLEGPAFLKRLTGLEKKTRIDILRQFDGLVRCGETCVVLGRPGSGCSTFLKTIACNTHGFNLTDDSDVNYQGIPREDIPKHFRGDFLYNAETDTHFPHLTVGQTLKFAALARTPKNRIFGVSRGEYATHMRDMTMASMGLMHTMETKVGDDFIRGVSGGERKRVSLAEATLNGSALQCWDNSTRGLDSANALEFIKNLQMSADMGGLTCFLSLYQASQSAYDLFDKVLVLYEGRQIFFGKTGEAQKFFEDMGYACAERQTTGDFLTSLTNPVERIVKDGYEHAVPRTPDEFERRWHESEHYRRLIQEIEEFNAQYPLGGEGLERFKKARSERKSNRLREGSAYTISFASQVRLCMTRGFQRLRGDMSMAFVTVFGNSAMSLVISSMFYNMQPTTTSFFSRGALLFFAILMNAFSSALEILLLYAQRPIVEKHTRYALYHPSAEAVSSMIVDMPTKTITALVFNLILYFMTHLRREAGSFFVFFLFSFTAIMVMSMLFRTIGSCSRTLSQAMTPTCVLMLALVIYTGFTIPVDYMRGWAKAWIRRLNPLSYAFESVMINEFQGRYFHCDSTMPTGGPYDDMPMENKACVVTGYVPPIGDINLSGTAYIGSAYQYYPVHLWRNFGILIGFMCFFCLTHLLSTELIQAARSKGEVLVFKRGHIPKRHDDEEAQRVDTHTAAATQEAQNRTANLARQDGIFQWMDVCYDIKVSGPEKTRRLLDHVDGWVKPGTLTSLMGASGAGKTTLLNVLASRVTMGVVTGDMLVNGRERNKSFQRKTGYVQQQDLHMETSTVREALTFSALLRQPRSTPRQEKLDYVDEVIRILEMEDYAEAVVGVPGEGLNVEQRKRLTIGVELAAKPALLLFLDEPTSGLDSQTSWSICSLMRKLADNGQAIMCTIHQPSAILFQSFDRLLFLKSGGQTVYFGDIGPNSRKLIDYFERNGSDPCPPGANPAEWMLEVVGAAPGSVAKRDWFQVWCDSPERAELRKELTAMSAQLASEPENDANEQEMMDSYAAPYFTQLRLVTQRVFQQYWRTPTYIWAKLALCTVAPLFIGFSMYMSPRDQQGLQNQMFSVFMTLITFSTLLQQQLPHFVVQRDLFEAREMPSKSYSWHAFLLGNIVTELPWQTLAAVLQFVTFYYPVGMYKNAQLTGTMNERAGLFFLTVWQFQLFTSTFGHMVIAGVDLAETASNIANLVFSLTLLMCGVLATPDKMPGFWIFMYRVSPFTYMIAQYLIAGVSNAPVECSPKELLQFKPPQGQTCDEYVGKFLENAGGYLKDKTSTDICKVCPIASTDGFLKQISIDPDVGWRNFGITWAYIVFNVFAALFLYWLARVPKKSKIVKERQKLQKEKEEKEAIQEKTANSNSSG